MTNMLNPFFSSVFSGAELYTVIGVALLSAVIFLISAFKITAVFQQSGYSAKTFVKRIKHTAYKSRLNLLSMMVFLSSFVITASLSPLLKSYSALLLLVPFTIFSFFYIKEEKETVKIPLKVTKRVVRLATVFFLLLIILTFGLILLGEFTAYITDSFILSVFRFNLIPLTYFAIPYILSLSGIILSPLEKGIKERIKKKAKRELDGFHGIKIGITGSFGKTSVKNILYTLLSEKYKVKATPESYNTPMGIALSLDGLNDCEVFIAEMGARNIGDIKELADMVNPEIGILTGINNQHIESFKTLENIKSAKYELFSADSVKTGFFSADSDCANELYEKFDKEKYSVGISGKDIYAKDISLDGEGTEFTLVIDGKEKKVKTCLLGKHAVSNIVLAGAVAYKSGLDIDLIASGIEKIKPVPHRLSIVPSDRGITVIDDGYNSNEDGFKNALEVLSYFKGKKVLITCGLVELGEKQEEVNEELGFLAGKVADAVITVGQTNEKALKSGLIRSGLDENNIYTVLTLDDTKEILKDIVKAGDTALFINDLPDGYR